jgi:hypothetical protein
LLCCCCGLSATLADFRGGFFPIFWQVGILFAGCATMAFAAMFAGRVDLTDCTVSFIFFRFVLFFFFFS